MSKQHLYTGKAGQLAVMAEFVVRGYNVSVPEIDIGDDLFVVRDATGELYRIQVKTANAKELKQSGYSATFRVPLAQLARPQTPDLNYVLVVRSQERWAEFIVISRKELYVLRVNHDLGSVQDGDVIFSLSFSTDDVLCKGQSLQPYRNQWARWPRISHDRVDAA